MKRRNVSILVVLICTFLLFLAACGEATPPPIVAPTTSNDPENMVDSTPDDNINDEGLIGKEYPEGTLVIWTYGMPEYMRIWFQNYIDREDTAVKGVTVKMVNYNNEAEVRQQVMMELASGTLENLPTAISTFPVSMQVLVENNLLKDVTGYFEPYKKEFVDGTFDQATLDGKIYGLPYVLQPKMIFYNNDIFEKYNLDVSKLDTFEGYLELGRELYEASNGKSKLSYADPGSYTWRYWFRRGLMPQANANIWSADGKSVVFDTDAGTRKAFEYFDTLFTEDLLLKAETFQPAWYEATRNQEIATFYFESFLDSFLRANLADMSGSWRSRPAPVFDDIGTAGAQVIGMYVLMNKPDDPYTELFVEMMLDFHFNIEARNKWTTEMIEQGLPTEHPITHELLSDPFWQEPSDFYGGQSYRQQVTASFNNPSENLIVTENDAEADSIISNELEKYVAGGQDIDATIQNIGNLLRQNLNMP